MEAEKSDGEPVRLVALAGSLGASSSNAAMLAAAARLAHDSGAYDLAEFERLADIPLLDPALDVEGGPPAVADLRARLAAADGFLIFSPEYGHSMPGVLKNALDWLVGGGELANLPVGIISASPTITGGIRAQIALIQTLLAQSARVVATLAIPAVKGKLDADGNLADESARRRIGETLRALAEDAAVVREQGLRFG